MEPRQALLSRLETGLWAELPEPDLDVRLRYAQQQAKFRRLPLSREQLLLIARTARMSGGFPASSSGWRPTAPCSAAIFPNRICSTSCGRAATAPR